MIDVALVLSACMFVLFLFYQLSLKVHFVIHSLIPPLSTKKVESMCAKYFLQIYLFEEIIAELNIYYRHEKYTT